jgi:hypothetical protein
VVNKNLHIIIRHIEQLNLTAINFWNRSNSKYAKTFARPNELFLTGQRACELQTAKCCCCTESRVTHRVGTKLSNGLLHLVNKLSAKQSGLSTNTKIRHEFNCQLNYEIDFCVNIRPSPAHTCWLLFHSRFRNELRFERKIADLLYNATPTYWSKNFFDVSHN